jgi:hypothetical protein
MGNEPGKEQDDYQFGLRIMGMDNNSPLIHKVALYEDFIREINGFQNMRYLKEHPQAVAKAGNQWTLVVYNLISDTEREVVVTVK